MSAWTALHAAYLAAEEAERSYDAAHIDDAPPPIRQEIWDESSRLGRIRHDAENALMALPATDGAMFARKYLVARGDGREVDCWDRGLEDDAKLLAGAPSNASVWADAEARLTTAKAAIDAHTGPDGEIWDALVAVLTDAELALVALVPETLVQAVRRIDVGLSSGPLIGVDPDALIADAVRLMGAAHG